MSITRGTVITVLATHPCAGGRPSDKSWKIHNLGG